MVTSQRLSFGLLGAVLVLSGGLLVSCTTAEVSAPESDVSGASDPSNSVNNWGEDNSWNTPSVDAGVGSAADAGQQGEGSSIGADVTTTDVAGLPSGLIA